MDDDGDILGEESINIEDGNEKAINNNQNNNDNVQKINTQQNE